jgi:thiol-disulfide isomerase/thioredoxin
MNRILALPLLAGLAIAAFATGTKPMPATAMVDDAVKKAKAEHKGVLVIFHASWCGWCHQLDKTLNTPAFKQVMDKDYVILHVTVLEDAKHKDDENPGGGDLMTKLGWDKTGIPFFAVLNEDGQEVADSKVIEGKDPKPQNMGYPAQTLEINHFLDMLKAGNSALTDDDTATLHKVLDDRAAEIKAKLAQHG